MCPAVPLYPLQKARHCEASAHTGVAIRTPKRLPYDPLPYTQNPLRKPRLPEGILMPNFNFSLKRHAADQCHQA